MWLLQTFSGLRKQARHLRDKHGKLLLVYFFKIAAPALLADLVLLYEQVGVPSGLTGCVQDMSDSSQNNRRAEEMASLKVVPHSQA